MLLSNQRGDGVPQSGRRGGAYSMLLGRPTPPFFFFWKRPIVKTDVL